MTIGESSAERLEQMEQTYSRLDRFLLHLVAAELGYAGLLVLGSIVVAVSSLAGTRTFDFWDHGTEIGLAVLPHILALPVNLAAGIAGIVLNVRTDHYGYPGTGHLLNWVFLAANVWVFLAGLLLFLPAVIRGY